MIIRQLGVPDADAENQDQRIIKYTA